MRKAYPKGSGDIDLWNFFDSRFDGYWIKDDTKALNADLKTYGPAVNYWSHIRNRATELLGRQAVPGVDYALSELVHCKSQKEIGVKAALSTCAGRYLEGLLSCSVATAFVLVGMKAFNHWNSLDGLPQVPLRDGSKPFEIAGRKRIAIFLPAPAFFGKKKFIDYLSQQKLAEIRALLQ